MELDGISAVIEEFVDVSRASVLKIGNDLHGFYATTKPIDEEALAASVKLALPYYSVPTHWHFVQTMPLTANGKVNKIVLRDLASIRRTRDDSVVKMALNASMEDMTVSAEGSQQSSSASSLARDVDSEKASAIVETEHSTPTSISGKSVVELEKGTVVIEAGLSTPDVYDRLPAKHGFHGQRWIRHRALILYHRFFSIVVLVNLAVAGFILHRKIGQNKRVLADLATASAANLCMAILMRSEPMINLLFTICCSVPKSFPLAIRRHCARIFHLGGIHSGCAIASTLFLTIFTITATVESSIGIDSEQSVSTAVIVLSFLIMTVLVVIASMSHPAIRIKYHNIWEMIHRFGGWSALIMLWVQTFLSTKDLNPNMAPSTAYLTSPPVWLLSISTAAIIIPWLHLRKVAVRTEVLSNHAVRLWFDYATPVAGSAVRLAERPLIDWHGFAAIANPRTAQEPNASGFSVIVSRAGDFTGRTIERAPTQIWVRGVPTCGVLRVATLFRSVVLVATGSGIGPCLAVILAKKVPARILWTAPNPEQTFGKKIVGSVTSADPNAVIHNTRTMGKPNMSLMAYKMWKESGAEAVLIISNKKLTDMVVYDLEVRGVPTYGALFDS